MRIAVIGPGGVGGFLAAVLGHGGHEVSVLARGAHLAAIQQRGLQMRSQQFGDMSSKPVASDDPERLGKAELVIIAVKMYDFKQAAEAAAVMVAAGGSAMTIQNGLDAPDELAGVVGSNRVLIGTASIEATILEPGVIGHLVPIHSLTLSEYQGPPTSKLESIVELLKRAEVNVSILPDGRQALWDKASSLIPIATITAATGAGIGPIYGLPEMRTLLQTLIAEAGAVASASGHPVKAAQDGFMAMMAQAAKVRPDFSTSMERDFQKGKRTELEWLTGTLVRIAAERKVDVPAHRALYAVLKLKEQRAQPAARQVVGAAHRS
jgi:2-dehydropantoate 2-reductase